MTWYHFLKDPPPLALIGLNGIKSNIGLVRTTQQGTKLDLIGGTIAPWTTALGDNCTSKPFQVRFKSDKKQNWSSKLIVQLN